MSNGAVAGPPAIARRPALLRWVVRVALLVAALWALGVACALFSNWRTEVWNISTTEIQTSPVMNWGQFWWGVATSVAGLGLLWALVSSLRGLLRLRSWMPLVCLMIVILAGWWQADQFQPAIG